MPPLLAANPLENFSALTLACLLAWILSVCLHEFAHALVAFLGGDRSVAQRGYLSLDPTRYIDPVMTLLIPAVVLLLGGLPLPGGAVLIDRSRLRSRRWETAVSAAGPAANLLLCLLIVIVMHPRLGLVDHDAADQPNWVLFLGAMGLLQFYAVLLNLLPIPPLDGFGLIEHRLDPETRWRMRQPRTGMMCLAILFFILWAVPGAGGLILRAFAVFTEYFGVPPGVFLDGYLAAFYGER